MLKMQKTLIYNLKMFRVLRNSFFLLIIIINLYFLPIGPQEIEKKPISSVINQQIN